MIPADSTAPTDGQGLGAHPSAARTMRASNRTITGIVALVVAIVCLFIASLLPSGFVIRQPGPVVNTLGEVQDAAGKPVKLISIPDGIESYPTDGTLSLTTVQIVGSRDETPNWLQLAAAWFDSSKSVVTVDSVFPKDQTAEQRQEQDTLMMTNSQHDATAAALKQLKYDIPTKVQVASVQDDGAGKGILQPGDIINTVDGTAVSDVTQLRAALATGKGKPATLNITREGQQSDVTVTPREGEVEGEKLWLIGVGAGVTYDLPIDITIQLNNIGGPSAGMMFALGIIDTLTPGSMTGGQPIAGTGTIDPSGVVGPIGGIQQKLYGARDAGAKYFLAPETNCNEVVGHVPDGLQVVKVATLAEAESAVETIGSQDKAQIAKLATCTAP